jgi:hypothetical protein
MSTLLVVAGCEVGAQCTGRIFMHDLRATVELDSLCEVLDRAVAHQISAGD